MDAFEKLACLSHEMQYEPAEEYCSSPPRSALVTESSHLDQTCGASCIREVEPPYASPPKVELVIHRAIMPGGKRIPLLKTLLTSACERDCYYCSFRAGRDFRRETFKPDDMARTFMQLVAARTAEGLFLSSGVAGGGARTQDRLIATAEILRFKLGFRGYLHLKIMPGAEKAQVERCMQLADRVSINLEAPNTRYLAQLAPHKTFFDELLRPLQWVDEIRSTQPAVKGWNGRWPSTTTQFVVGGADERDVDLLSTTVALQKGAHLSRAYYSGFNPVMDTPLENRPPVNPWRQHRLYQASFLLRDYGFDLEEMPFSQSGDLPLETDPKLAWARENLAQAPVEVNHADRAALLRVPGIGPKSVHAILAARRQGCFHELRDLHALGIRAARAAPFILLDGKRPTVQLALF